MRVQKMKKAVAAGLAAMMIFGSVSFAEASNAHDYSKEKQVHQYRAHGGDRAEITDTMKEVIKNLKNPDGLKKYVADGEKSKAIYEYLKSLTQYKDIQFSDLQFAKFYKVEGEIHQNFRGIVQFKFIGINDKGKSIERTDLLAVAKRGKEETDWKIWDVLWKDSGIDVSDVKLFQLEAPAKGEEICEMTTSAGMIKLRLFPNKAPLAVKNFIGLAKKGFYDNMMFGRVIDDFVIQTGDPEHEELEEVTIFGDKQPFEDEFTNDLFNFRGALCMANSGPNTNGSSVYIVQRKTVKPEILNLCTLPLNAKKKYEELGGLPYLDTRHTVFGHVFEGMDIVDKIAAQETNEDDVPVKDAVRILKIEFKKVK